MTWGAYLPGIARTVVNCNQNCNHGPGAGVVRQVVARSGVVLTRGRGRLRAGLRVAVGSCLRAAMALDGPRLVRSARRRPRAARPLHSLGECPRAAWAPWRPDGDRAAVRHGGVPGVPGGCSGPRGSPAGARGWAGDRPGPRCRGSRPASGRGRASGYAWMCRGRLAVSAPRRDGRRRPWLPRLHPAQPAQAAAAARYAGAQR